MRPVAPRIIAALLSVIGAYWAVKLAGWLIFPETLLVALPGYLIFAGWICRAVDFGARTIYLAMWLASMIWHMMLVTIGPLIAMLLSDHFPVYYYGAAVLPLSIVGFILDARFRQAEPDRSSS